MRKKEFVNNLEIVFLSFVFSIGYWMICNYQFINQIPNYEMYKELNASIYGYSSLQSYFLIYLLPFLMSLNLFLKNEHDYIVIRYKERKVICYYRIKLIIKALVFIFFPHFIIDVFTMIKLFGFKYLITMNYFFYEFLQIVMVCLFFVLISLIYECFCDYINHQRALITVSLIFIIYYFFNRIFIHYILLRDLCVKDLLIIHSFTNFELFISFIKYCILIVIVFTIMRNQIREKDIYEK